MMEITMVMAVVPWWDLCMRSIWLLTKLLFAYLAWDEMAVSRVFLFSTHEIQLVVEAMAVSTGFHSLRRVYVLGQVGASRETRYLPGYARARMCAAFCRHLFSRQGTPARYQNGYVQCGERP